MPRVNKKDAAAAAAIAAAPVAPVMEQHPAELPDETPQGNVVVPIAAFLNLRDSVSIPFTFKLWLSSSTTANRAHHRSIARQPSEHGAGAPHACCILLCLRALHTPGPFKQTMRQPCERMTTRVAHAFLLVGTRPSMLLIWIDGLKFRSSWHLELVCAIIWDSTLQSAISGYLFTQHQLGQLETNSLYQILKGLGAIQDVVTQMNSTYVSSTNAMLIESGFDERYLPSIVTRASAPEASTDDKKEKKKRVHDPNAPKRPLTPFFLYMQTARPIIAADLGPDQPKKAVAIEGVRRWREMAEGDKQLWANAYTDNLKLYNARVHAYKAGDMNAKDMDDAEAAHYAETHNVAALPGDELDLAADAQLSAEHLGELPGDMASTPTSPEASPEPPKIPAATPKAKAARAKKGKQTQVATPQTIEAPVVPIVPSSNQKAASPDKKRKRGSVKKADEVVASIESEETPKNKSAGRKKKARGE